MSEEKVLNKELTSSDTVSAQKENAETKVNSNPKLESDNPNEKVLNEELVNSETDLSQKKEIKTIPNPEQEPHKQDLLNEKQTLEKKDEIPSEHSLTEVKEEVIKILKTCYDPEIPVDIWELGLIYDIVVATNKDVLIVMTLTSPSCPVAGTLPTDVEQKVKEHPMVNDCKVQLTFDPPWSQKMMSEVAKLELGFL